MTDKLLPVVELFGPTIQGEGALAGQVSYFVRFGSCSYRCSWCDSMHAVAPEQIKAHVEHCHSDDILAVLAGLSNLPPDVEKPWVTLTGGDPCLHDLTDLVFSLKNAGYRVAVETQGAIWKNWLIACDLVTCSPKGPSSGMQDRFSASLLTKYQQILDHQDQLVLKFVIFTEEDLAWAKSVRMIFGKPRIFLSVGTPSAASVGILSADLILASYRRLVDKVLADPFWYDATVLPQLHALLWGRELGR